MIDESTLIRVKAKRKVIYDLGKPNPLAIIPRCPLCKRRHVHGWRTGPRVAHCDQIRGNYFLECREAPTMMERVEAQVSSTLAKAQLWFELKVMLPVLYKLGSYGVRW